jgi:hypothetical protein
LHFPAHALIAACTPLSPSVIPAHAGIQSSTATRLHTVAQGRWYSGAPWEQNIRISGGRAIRADRCYKMTEAAIPPRRHLNFVLGNPRWHSTHSARTIFVVDMLPMVA